MQNGVDGALVRNVTTSGTYRNGMSVISAADLLVEDCHFLDSGNTGQYNGGDTLNTRTGGTSPRAGVDLEPDDPSQDVLRNVTFRRVVASGNVDDAFAVSTTTNAEVSILFDGCVATDCSGSWGSGWDVMELHAPGSVVLQDCSTANMGGGG